MLIECLNQGQMSLALIHDKTIERKIKINLAKSVTSFWCIVHQCTSLVTDLETGLKNLFNHIIIFQTNKRTWYTKKT